MVSFLQRQRATSVFAGLLVAALATCAAALSHSLAGASAPSPFAVLIATLICTPLATYAVRRKHTASSLAVAVVAIQGLFHWVFVWLTPKQLLVAAHTHHTHPALDYTQLLTAAASADTTGMAVVGGAALAAGLSMLAHHLLAAVVAAGLVIFAERGLLLVVTADRQLRARILQRLSLSCALPRVVWRSPVAQPAPLLSYRPGGTGLTRAPPAC